jgi:hypothetical protein
MRFRSVVLPAVVVAAGVVVAPTPANAAVQCGIVVPTKVVVNAPAVDMDFNLTSGCYTNNADHAYWDFVHAGHNVGFPMNFEAADLADGPAY